MDPRFDVPLYTRAEVALHLGLPLTTLGAWLRSGALEAPTAPARGEVTITFAGLVETHMLRELRQAGLPLQAIEDAAVTLRSKLDRHHPLAWQGLAHDGRDLLIELAADGQDPAWERIRDSQGGLPGLVRRGSAAITWAADGYPSSLRLVTYTDVAVHIDPARAEGRPIVEASDDREIRVEDVVDQARAGTPYRTIAARTGLEATEIEALVRPHIRPPTVHRRRKPTDDVLL
jgi:uncharacterized protein (DUF433 family)